MIENPMTQSEYDKACEELLPGDVYAAEQLYNQFRCETDAPPTTIGDINFIYGDDEPTKGGWPEYEKRLIRGC